MNDQKEPVLDQLDATEVEVANIKAVPKHYSSTFVEQLTQALSWPIPDLPPLNRAANTAVNATGWIVGPVNMGLFKRAMGKVFTGAGTATFNTTIQFLAGNTTNSLQAATGAAWTWTTITSGPVVILNSTASSATLEIRADQMTAATNYLALLVNNNCAQLFAAELIASQPAYSPASQYTNTSALVQTVM